MEKSSGIKTSTVVGIIILAVTLVLFFLTGGEKELIHWLALLFVLLSECAFFWNVGSMQRQSGGNHVLMAAGSTSIFLLYWICAIVISALFLVFFKESVSLFAAIQIVLLLITAAGYALIRAASAIEG